MRNDGVAFRRERKFVDATIDAVGRDGIFVGYASLFGKADLARDVVDQGAFSRALRLRGAAGVRMLYQHDPAEPIGTWLELREDDRGLLVRGRLAPGVARHARCWSCCAAARLTGFPSASAR